MNNNSSGIGIGAILAVIISWTVNKSVLWAIFHGLCSWLYVLYYVILIRGVDLLP